MIVTPKTCRKCSGKGFITTPRVHLGMPGTCFTCDGAGVVESDPATLKALREAKAAAKARFAKRIEFAHAARAWDIENGMKWLHQCEDGANATLGLDLLEMQDPTRFAKAQDSFAAGRVDVFPALVAWLRTEAKPTH